MTILATASPGSRTRRLAPLAAALVLAQLLASCSDPGDSSGPSVGTNSNWLRACATDEQCGDDDLPACECGACTTACEVDADCAALENARCALGTEPAAWAECGSRAPAIGAGICLPRCFSGSCNDQQACVDGACVLAPLPEVPFCADVAARDEAQRRNEDELLTAVAGLRSSGGQRCFGAAGPAAPAPALRYDTRLVCAARVWADDIARTGTASGTDSAGRTGQERMLAAGYTARLWGESYAVDTLTISGALAEMLVDEGSCRRLTDPQYTDIGVANTGRTWVVSIGVE